MNSNKDVINTRDVLTSSNWKQGEDLSKRFEGKYLCRFTINSKIDPNAVFMSF